MQLKKSTRDSAYPDGPDQPADGEMDATQDQYYTDLQPSAARPTRALNPEDIQSRTPSTARAESVIDAHSTFDGRYETEQDLRVEGTISGEVVCRGLLTIEADATANAKIQTRDAAIRGRVDGEVVCSGRLLLTGTAVVTGTFKAATLVVEEGATLRGTVETVQETPVPIAGRVTRAADPAPVPDLARPEAGTREAPSAPAAAARNGGTNRNREAPSFALVSSDERTALDRN